MEKIKLKDKNVKNKIIIIFSILFVILIILNMILSVLEQKEKKDSINYEDIKTVQDVLSYYGCRFISEEISSLKDFNKDIKLVFKYNLYTEEKSNEEFYDNVIKDIAKVLNHVNFRLIDETKDIEIKVICKNKKIYDIIINDITDYFVYMDSQINLSKYVEIETTELQIEAPEIQNLINNNWNNVIEFGTRESIFESYYNYFDEGIKTRSIGGKIYNIIFTNKYSGNIVNGIFPGVDLSTIKTKLGDPTFEDEELNLIGYKSNQIYVFFTKNEISVYRVANSDTTDFFKLVDKLLNDELDLLDFMNELTYLWPDYSEYKYDSNYAFISYPLKGIDVKIGYEDTNAIVLYNNCNAELSKIKRYLENTEFVANLQLDNVFNAEKRRTEHVQTLLDKCKEYENEKNQDNITNDSFKFGIYPDIDKNDTIMKMRFVSKDGSFPDRELNDNVYTYVWLNDDILIFSQKYTGIYYYNVITGEKNVLITGEEEYKIKSFENGVLKYDDSELSIQY